MMLANPLFVAILVGLMVLLLGYIATFGKHMVDAQFDGFDGSKGFIKYLAALGKSAAEVMPEGATRMSESYRSQLELRLRKAGNPWGMSPVEFRLLQIGCLIAGAVFGGVAYYLVYDELSMVPWPVFILISSVVGWIIPGRELKKRIADRLISFRRALPAALDFIQIQNTIHANVLNSIITITPRLEKSVVKDEFTILCNDLKSGRDPKLALEDMAERAPSPEMESFVNVIIQSITMSTSANDALEERSKTAREEYIGLINEKIASLSSRIMLYLGPSMILALVLVSIAPSMISIMSSLS